MTKAEIKINLNEILKFIKFAGHKIPTEHYSWDSEKHDWIEAINESIKMVEQEPKTGHWIKMFLTDTSDIDGQCSECGFIHKFIDGHTAQYNHCPNCGCRMVEPQESEE